MTIEFIIPYWGDPKLLFQAIESVRAQTHSNWKLTVIDDAYPGEAAQEYIAGLRDDRIRYMRNVENLGNAGNSYKATRVASEEFAVLLGHDDLVEPQYVEDVSPVFQEHPRAVIVQPAVTLIDADGNVTDTLGDKVKRRIGARVRKRGEVDGEEVVASVLTGNWLYTPALCIRTQSMAHVKYRERSESTHDLAFVVDILTAGGTMVFDDRPLYRYRRHPASDSSTRARDGSRFDLEFEYFATIAPELEALGWHKAARAARRHTFTRLHALKVALDALVDGDLRRIPGLVAKAIRRVPRDIG